MIKFEIKELMLQPARNQMAEVLKELNALLEKPGVIKLFATMPDRALPPDKNRKPPILQAFLNIYPRGSLVKREHAWGKKHVLRVNKQAHFLKFFYCV